MAAPPIVPVPSTKEIAEAMATLDDWRTIVYVFIVLFVIMVTERGFSAWGMRQERKQMAAEREKMWSVADKFTAAAQTITDQTNAVANKIEVLSLLAARVEVQVEADEQAGRR